MSSIIKMTLLLAAVVCVSVAQMNEPGQQCLCQRIRDRLPPRSQVKNIQIYPATIFCDQVEILVTSNNGLRFCLNPKLKQMKKLLANMRKQNTSGRPPSTPVTSTPVSTTSNPSRI